MKKLCSLSLAAVLLFVGCNRLSRGDATVAVDNDNFDEVVLQSDKPVLVDFWAEWCGPCKILEPTVEEIAQEYEGRAVVAKLNVDVAGEIATEYGVHGIPTLIVFKNGTAVFRIVGVQPKSVIVDELEKALRS